MSYWTYEYAFGYIVGPFCGAFLAGVVDNIITRKIKKLTANLDKDGDVDKTQLSGKSDDCSFGEESLKNSPKASVVNTPTGANQMFSSQKS